MPSETPSPSNPWYSDATVGRDRSHVLKKRETDWKAVREDPTALFVLQTARGIYYQEQEQGGLQPSPIFYTFEQLATLLGEETIQQSMKASNAKQLLAWLGEHDNHNYWVCYQADFVLPEDENDSTTKIAGLREFGDRMTSSVEAAILATSNGLVEFHKAHPFCSKCGSPTRVSKAGASRKCTNTETCGVSVYPRMDVASIMLITSPCEQYALLGRKANWPQGRYSTLAGFAEVGETLEQCCVRETMEESGVAVDSTTVRFVCSQPWPFPRSLMVGFRARAAKIAEAATKNSDDDSTNLPLLPPIEIEELEMEDIQWFPKEYVKERLDGGSTAMGFQPSEKEQEFHIPGPSSLARILISQWANE